MKNLKKVLFLFPDSIPLHIRRACRRDTGRRLLELKKYVVLRLSHAFYMKSSDIMRDFNKLTRSGVTVPLMSRVMTGLEAEGVLLRYSNGHYVLAKHDCELLRLYAKDPVAAQALTALAMVDGWRNIYILVRKHELPFSTMNRPLRALVNAKLARRVKENGTVLWAANGAGRAMVAAAPKELVKFITPPLRRPKPAPRKIETLEDLMK